MTEKEAKANARNASYFLHNSTHVGLLKRYLQDHAIDGGNRFSADMTQQYARITLDHYDGQIYEINTLLHTITHTATGQHADLSLATVQAINDIYLDR